MYSQKGAPNRRFLAPGMAQSFHWTMIDMPHLLQLSFSSGVWASSGGFKIDTVGDTVLQVRSLVTREDCQKYPCACASFSRILSVVSLCAHGACAGACACACACR